jgi:hypothetical protein
MDGSLAGLFLGAGQVVRLCRVYDDGDSRVHEYVNTDGWTVVLFSAEEFMTLCDDELLSMALRRLENF